MGVDGMRGMVCGGWRRAIVAGVSAVGLLAASIGMAAPVDATSMWFPVSAQGFTVGGNPVQVAVEAVIGYSGGTVAGKTSSWVQIPESLTAAMDAQAGQSVTPVGWQVSGIPSGTYLQVVGVQYGGTTFMATGATGTYTWNTANAWSGSVGGAILYPSTSGSTTGVQYAATGDVLPAASGSTTTTVQCGKTVLQFNGAGQVATQAQGIYGGTTPNAPVEQFNLYNSDGSGLNALAPPKDACNSGQSDAAWLQQFGGNAIPILGSGKMIYPVDCQAPNLIVNGMCVLQSSLPSNETVTQAVYGLLQSYYGSVASGTWFTWQATDPVIGPGAGTMQDVPQPPGTYYCGNDNGRSGWCVTKPNP